MPSVRAGLALVGPLRNSTPDPTQPCKCGSALPPAWWLWAISSLTIQRTNAKWSRAMKEKGCSPDPPKIANKAEAHHR